MNRKSLLGIGLTVLASLLFVLGYAVSKVLVETDGLTALQVTFLRAVIMLGACCAASAWPRTGVTWRRILNPPRAWEQRAAALTLIASIYSAVVAYGLLPVTEASALGFTAPLLLTALAGLILHEHVSPRRWLSAAAGFAGMLLIVRPGLASLSIGSAAALASALAYALYLVLVRRLCAVATSLDSVIQMAVVGTVLLAGTMGAAWQPLSGAVFGVVLAATVIQTAGLVCISAAMQQGEASALAPWQFSGLIWALVLDAALFGSPPSLLAWAGCGLILVGGFLAHEKLRAPQPEPVTR